MGQGTQASPGGSLGASHATYADYLDARGRWLDAGSIAAGDARFVRRWWLARTGAGSSEMLLFQVLVATVPAGAKGSLPVRGGAIIRALSGSVARS